MMPKVFTGKVVIPAEHLDEYLEALARAEKEREPFRAYLTTLLGEFVEHLAERYSDRTVNKQVAPP
jgi:FAD/FMN-containing dehydrogenase